MEHLNELVSPTKFSEKLNEKLGKLWTDSGLKPVPNNGASIDEKWETVFENIRKVLIKVASEPDFPIDFNFGDTQFSEYAKRMENIDAEGKLKKVVVRSGIGDIIPPDSTVYILFKAYLEHEEYPFTSSDVYSKSPRKYELGSGSLCEGYDLAISTMKLGEKAHFLLSPDIAYGERGVPPLIPPDSEILIEVELCDIDKPEHKFLKMNNINDKEVADDEINGKEETSILIEDDDDESPVLNNDESTVLNNNKKHTLIDDERPIIIIDDDRPILIDESSVLIVQDENPVIKISNKDSNRIVNENIKKENSLVKVNGIEENSAIKNKENSIPLMNGKEKIIPGIKIKDIRTLLKNSEPEKDIKKNKKFQIVKKTVEELHQLGNKFHKIGNFTCANINYRKAENFLTTLECSNENDEKIRKEMLLKMIVNQIITLVNVNKTKSKPREAVKAALRAFQHIPAEAAQSFKLKYNLAKAYILLNEERKALQLLKEARKLEPDNEMIRNLFYKIDKEFTEREENETKCWIRAREKFPEHDTKEQYVEFLRGSIKNDLENYLENPLANIGMPWNYTSDERLTLKREAEKMNLTYEEFRSHPANVLISIHKKGSALLITEKDEILHEAKELLTSDEEEDFIGWDTEDNNKNEDISIVEEGTTLPKVLNKNFITIKSPLNRSNSITPKNSPKIVLNKSPKSMVIEVTSPNKNYQQKSPQILTNSVPMITESFSLKRSPITFRNIAPKPINVSSNVSITKMPSAPTGIIPRAIRSSINYPRIRGICTPRTRGGNYFFGRGRGHNFIGPGRGMYHSRAGPSPTMPIFNNYYTTSIKQLPPRKPAPTVTSKLYTEENNVCVILDSSDDEDDDDDEDDEKNDEGENNIPEFTDKPGCSGLGKK